jgi:3-phenylpropionate/cinnamic acid dioxygenase small subunit
MSSSEVEIANLLYRYAEYIDTGNFAAAAELFRHARVKVLGRGIVNADELLRIWEEGVTRYEDGTPRTKHVMTNTLIEVDEQKNTAIMRSYYTVLQAVDGVLQPVIAGRYHDEFERVNGKWRFSYRDYSLSDLIGRLHAHVPGFDFKK